MRKLKSEDMLQHKYLINPLFTSDGRFVVFTKDEAAEDLKGFDSKACYYDTVAKKYSELDFDLRINGYISNGCGGLYISSVSDNKTIVYDVNLSEDKKEKVCELEEGLSLIARVGDAFVVTKEYNCKPDGVAEKEYYEILDEVPFWYNGTGFINGIRNRIYIANITDASMKPVSGEYFNVDKAVLSKDGNTVYYYGLEYDALLPIKHEVRAYNIETGEERNLLGKDILRISFMDVIDDALILGASDMVKYGVHENPEVYKLYDDGRYVKLTDADMEIGNMSLSDCSYKGGCTFLTEGNTLYYVITERKGSHLYTLDCSGDKAIPEKITAFTGNCESIAVNNGKVYAVCLKDYNLHELCEIVGSDAIPVTEINASVMEDRIKHIPDDILFINSEGNEVDGWVLKPRDYDANKKYPMIINVHGGPKAIIGEFYNFENQLWADMGYFVIYCNPTGSSGRGNEFANIWGRYGSIDYEDIMQFIDVVLEKYPQIDRDNLFLTGGSYGGFMTNWMIGHTDIFAAAATQRSISNWLSDFNMSDISFQEAEHDHQATPWSDPEYLWSISPVAYADKVKTPLLIIHSDLDFHCCTTDGFQMLTALRYHGVEARMCLFHGENHTLARMGRPRNRIKRIDEITNWFESHKS